MKLVRFFFSIPFNPKGEWKKVINNSKSIKEDTIFMLLSGVLILKSYLLDLYTAENYFSFESIFIQL
jgi:hypothetical protein